MRITWTLSKLELSQAVADFVAKKHGRSVKCDVSFTVSPEYDFADRPTGTHSITSTVSFEEADAKVQP